MVLNTDGTFEESSHANASADETGGCTIICISSDE